MSTRIESNCLTDAPPEYCHYADEGCELAASCLNCPLPVCVYDVPGGKQKLRKRNRASEMARLRTKENRSIGEIAGMFGVSTRTVQRALKAVRTAGDIQVTSHK
ncbi:MAG TPA: HTH domain-containing protein [Dehalococcoidales bacterium]|nr:HTH domain-containing protein [Dehalococcoidales bacterium]